MSSDNSQERLCQYVCKELPEQTISLYICWSYWTSLCMSSVRKLEYALKRYDFIFDKIDIYLVQFPYQNNNNAANLYTSNHRRRNDEFLVCHHEYAYTPIFHLDGVYPLLSNLWTREKLLLYSLLHIPVRKM